MKLAAEEGLGFEAASLGELTQAFNTGVDVEVRATVFLCECGVRASPMCILGARCEASRS
jgi:hypothetical protein